MARWKDGYLLGYAKDKTKPKKHRTGKSTYRTFRGGSVLIREAPVKIYFVDPETLK
jgi:hypothetical protein